MVLKYFLILIFIFLSSDLFCQLNRSDTLQAKRDSLKQAISELDSLLKTVRETCSDFKLAEKPSWLNSKKVFKVFLNSCKRSSTYLVLYKSKIYNIIYFGEGSWHKKIDFGKFDFNNPSILNLKSNKYAVTVLWAMPISKNGKQLPCIERKKPKEVKFNVKNNTILLI